MIYLYSYDINGNTEDITLDYELCCDEHPCKANEFLLVNEPTTLTSVDGYLEFEIVPTAIIGRNTYYKFTINEDYILYKTIDSYITYSNLLKLKDYEIEEE